MTAKRDKGYLRELSRLVLTELQRNNLPTPFRLKRRLKLRKTNTDGWAVTIGTFTGSDAGLKSGLTGSHRTPIERYIIVSIPLSETDLQSSLTQ